MARTATELGYAHPLIGQSVWVRAGAKPAGWGDEDFDDPIYGGVSGRTVTDVAQAEDGHPFGTVEVYGWYWDFADIELDG
jgi:hypothetical protein